MRNDDITRTDNDFIVFVFSMRDFGGRLWALARLCRSRVGAILRRRIRVGLLLLLRRRHRRCRLLTLEIYLLFPVQNGLLTEVFRRPPVHREAALDVVDDEGDADHEGAAEEHDGDEEPAERQEAVVDDGEQGGGAGGRVDGLGEGHEGGGGGAGEGAADVLDGVKVVAVEEELGDGDANDGRQQLADEGIARLCEGGLYGVEFEDGGCALGVLARGARVHGEVERTVVRGKDLRDYRQWRGHGGSQRRERAWRRPG